MIEMMREIRKLQDQIDALRTIEIGGIWKAWTPTFGGFSTDPAGGIYRYTTIGNTCIAHARQSTPGTSDDTVFTLTAPVAASTTTNGWFGNIRYVDNGTNGTVPGVARILSSGTTIDLFTNYGLAGWTASGNKQVADMTIIYEI